MSGDYVERLEAFDSGWRSAMDDDLVSEVIAVIDGKPLRESDLRAALDELEKLRAEVDVARHEAKQCTAVYDHPIYGVRRCELPAHGYTEHFAGSMGGPVKWTDVDPQQLETKLPERPAQLLAAIQRWGGEWSPLRACRLLDTHGYVVTRERAHQIMKHLAERGHLEQVRPRAYTYRLKSEASQQPDGGARWTS